MAMGRFVAVAAAGGLILSGLSSGSRAGATPEPDLTFDERLLGVSEAVPGFGGAYVDERVGTFNVWLHSPTIGQAEQAQAAVSHVLDDPLLMDFQPVALQATYSFAQLHSWLSALTPEVLSLPGVVSTDLDDRRNLIVVGIEDLSQSMVVLSAIRGMAIPTSAVAIVKQQRRRFNTSLNNKHRPILGGLEIQFYDATESSTFICTLGFIAIRATLSNPPGLVTNSHCSSTQGAVDDPQVYYQPSDDIVGGNVIADEARDPALFTGNPCPNNRRCRYSDANFAPFRECGFLDLCDTTHSKGHLARSQTSSSTWDGTLWHIVAKADPIVGTTITKLGRSTGRTTGEVEQMCVNLNVADTNITLLCQGDADYASAGGDSGGSITRSWDGNRALSGIHWGSGGAFSPISQIQRTAELGNLYVCDGEPCG